ncbi:hypothetical protein FQA47_005180 [Oryzias melastigma]|uniref:Uncharacterized protein n=1 Tax=Oryzias melastigma TaxID=30732 RepID=A0A834C0L9_ORYME|nr:hypothetical protein FQA47_005180 [Oryzias melastigma]
MVNSRKPDLRVITSQGGKSLMQMTEEELELVNENAQRLAAGSAGGADPHHAGGLRGHAQPPGAGAALLRHAHGVQHRVPADQRRHQRAARSGVSRRSAADQCVVMATAASRFPAAPATAANTAAAAQPGVSGKPGAGDPHPSGRHADGQHQLQREHQVGARLARPGPQHAVHAPALLHHAVVHVRGGRADRPPTVPRFAAVPGAAHRTLARRQRQQQRQLLRRQRPRRRRRRGWQGRGRRRLGGWIGAPQGVGGGGAGRGKHQTHETGLLGLIEAPPTPRKHAPHSFSCPQTPPPTPHTPPPSPCDTIITPPTTVCPPAAKPRLFGARQELQEVELMEGAGL